MKIEDFVNDLHDVIKIYTSHDIDLAMRMLADSKTGRDRYLQLVRCAAIIGNYALTLPRSERLPAAGMLDGLALTSPNGAEYDHGLLYVRILQRPNNPVFYLESWNGRQWQVSNICGVWQWSRVEDLSAAVEKVARDTGRTALWATAIVRENYGAEAPAVPVDMPALTGEAPETIAEMITGAFRVVNSRNGFTVERWRGDGPITCWSGLLGECGEPLWPWREWQTVEAAEAAILEYGRRANVSVTVIRNDGAEITTASPGAFAFPRQEEALPPPWTLTGIVPVHTPPFPSQLENGTFKIKPTIDGKAWTVWQWAVGIGQHTKQTTGHWISFPIGSAVPTKYPTYWAAAGAIAEHAKTTPDQKAYILQPTPEDIARWRERGITVGAPPIVEVEQLAAAYAPPVPTSDDPVIITGTPAELGAAIAESAAEAVAGLAPVTPIGTKLPIPIGDDLWRVDEFTADHIWITVRDEITWDEVGEYLNPTAAPVAEPVDKYEIVPCSTIPGMFDVRHWRGKRWHAIAGGISKTTAEGVIRARQNDPESGVAVDVSNMARKAMSKARVRINGLIDCMRNRDEDPETDDAFIIERLQELMKILAPID